MTSAFRPSYSIPSIDQKDQPDVQSVEVTGPIIATIDGEVSLDDTGIINEISLVLAQLVAGLSVTETSPLDLSPIVAALSGLLTNTQLRAADLNVLTMNSLVPVRYDYVDLNYTGTDLTQVLFKRGGAAGTLVRTLTLAYSGGVLDTVTAT